jgi:hypothetical protein
MTHAWQFFRAGGVDQVLIQTGADIVNLASLDQKLWVALACPTRGVEFDTRTLDLIDTNHDGRIRPPELIAACEWAGRHLKDPEALIAGGDAIDIAAIDDGHESGAALADEARRILALLGKAEATAIALADVADRSKLLAAMRFNGDGVITPDTAEDDATRDLVQRIIDTQGGVADRNGQPGIDRPQAEAFFAQATALSAWHARGLANADVLPLGDRTLAAVAAIDAVRAKVDDFFTRCRLAGFDSRAVAALNPSIDDYRALAPQALDLQTPSIAELPLAEVQPHAVLPFEGGVNPAWAEALLALRRDAAQPLFGEAPDHLTETRWAELQQRLGACRSWLAEKPQTTLGALDLATLTDVAEPEAQARVLALLDEDAAIEPQNARIVELEKLVRFKRDLLPLLNNFVSFSAFYSRNAAIFQAGTLYLDGRSCDLTVPVPTRPDTPCWRAWPRPIWRIANARAKAGRW